MDEVPSTRMAKGIMSPTAGGNLSVPLASIAGPAPGLGLPLPRGGRISAASKGVQEEGQDWAGHGGEEGLGGERSGAQLSRHRRLCPPAQVLDLSHNQLSFVPPDLPEALEELHLQSNRISHVGPEAFLSTPSLRALFLRCPRWAVGTSVGPGGQGGYGPLPLCLPSRLPLGSGPTGFT